MPVMLPPGRAKLATSPVPTGSAEISITIGIVLVAFLSATIAGSPSAVTITFGRRFTSSTATAVYRSGPSAYRLTMVRFSPSIQP